MEQLQNFSPNDVHNGTLTQMFRNAGIDDVHSYVDDIRHENVELNEPSNRSGNFLNNAQSFFDKKSHGKNGLGNVKQIYHMVNFK
jgi:cell division septum initiation protein DivIVA